MTDALDSSLRSGLAQKLGGYSPLVLWYRAKRPVMLWRAVSPYGKQTSRFVAENGLVIKHGGFEGMKFPKRSVGHTNYLGAKLVGTYEQPVIDFLLANAAGQDLFVDLGSGDGYFLTGIGRIQADIRLIGYELNKYERDLAREIADINGVSIESRVKATVEELDSLPDGKLLLLCDLEGLEEDFLDPTQVPRLREATMIAEVHEHFRPGVTAKLTERFSPTHKVTYHAAPTADPSSIAELRNWDRDAAQIVVNDGHTSDNGWLSFVPNSRNA